VKKEFFIFVVIFFVLSLGMHMNQWVSHPLEHFSRLMAHDMPYHPLLYTFIAYVLIGVLRLAIALVIKLFGFQKR